MSLSQTLITWSEVKLLSRSLIGLQQLSLAKNRIAELEVIEEDAFLNLHHLDLEGNLLQSWSEIQKLGSLKSLRSLNLNENAVDNVLYGGGFDQLTYLNINRNQIRDWGSVNSLNLFPALQELRIAFNPVSSSISDSEYFFIEVLSRIGNLSKLNGSLVGRGPFLWLALTL